VACVTWPSHPRLVRAEHPGQALVLFNHSSDDSLRHDIGEHRRFYGRVLHVLRGARIQIEFDLNATGLS
jgi:hypothetical protein